MIRRGEQPEEYSSGGGGVGGDVSSMVLHQSSSSSGSQALVSLTMPNLAMVPLANQRSSRLKEANYLLSGHTD